MASPSRCCALVTLASARALRLRADTLEARSREAIADAFDVIVKRGHGGVVVQQPSATLWKFRDGLIHRVEFHLDREQALASAREPL